MVPIREIYSIDSFRQTHGGLPSREDSDPNQQHHTHTHNHNHDSNNSNNSKNNMTLSTTTAPLTAAATATTPPPIRPIVVSDFDLAFLNLLKHGQIDHGEKL